MNKDKKTTMPLQNENCTRSSHIYCSRATHRSTCSRQSGFTIIEVMVAVVIFAVGLTAIAGMQTQSIAQSSISDQMSMRVNAITYRAETLTRIPVMDESLGLDGSVQIDVTVGGEFEEENMCAYGETCDGKTSEYCDYNDGWEEGDYTDKSPHALCQRITQGYPLPNLVTIEVEAIPKGLSEYKTKQRTVSLAYVRSRRWN